MISSRVKLPSFTYQPSFKHKWKMQESSNWEWTNPKLESPQKIKISNTFSKTLQNVDTMFWVKSDVYTSPTFFTIESMRYNTGSLTSACTYMNRTNIFGGVVVCWCSTFLPVLINSSDVITLLYSRKPNMPTHNRAKLFQSYFWIKPLTSG
jgi:hypothetical protein